jgi:hypothetical protein
MLKQCPVVPLRSEVLRPLSFALNVLIPISIGTVTLVSQDMPRATLCLLIDAEVRLAAGQRYPIDDSPVLVASGCATLVSCETNQV